MARAASVRKLSRLTLRLIEKDLKRIATHKIRVNFADGKWRDEEPAPGTFALTLTRYFAAIREQERAGQKFEDELRERLKKMSKKQLMELAGVESGVVKGKRPPK